VMRRLRLRVAQGLYESAADICPACTPPMRVHTCLVDGGKGIEARVNHNVFIEAAGNKVKECPALVPLLQFHRNRDALELAHTLTCAAEAGPEEVRPVGMMNGANNKLLGNHWFASGARNAIDENFHRRCAPMCIGSLLMNMGTHPFKRDRQELCTNVLVLGGSVVELLPEKKKTPAVAALEVKADRPLCQNGCGRAAAGRFPTCCRTCVGATDKHKHGHRCNDAQWKTK